MFIRISGERFRVLIHGVTGAWVISCDNYQMPVYLDQKHFEQAERIPAPEEYAANKTREMTKAQRKRYELLESVLDDPHCIMDSEYRQDLLGRIAKENGTTVRRLNRLFYRYLTQGCLTQPKQREPAVRREFDDAIRKYYFSAKRNSLRTAYELFVLENYTNNGMEVSDAPTWNAFRSYYYRHWSKSPEKEIARNGLTNYQRNQRPLYGSAMQYRESIGCYQIDETPADIYLVSKWDRSQVIGRPNVYLAVDTASGLIAGLYVGLEAGENAMTACLANAAADKVAFCAQYGIEIASTDWPSYGLPSEIISDRGGEFVGDRIEELCIAYGIDCQALPPFRAEEKPLVERAMGLIQDSYKSLLRGRGVIGDDVAERWATDYRKQAVLTIDEYTAVVIHCVLALNKGRVLSGIGHLTVDAPNTTAELWKWLIENGKSTLLEVNEKEVYLRSLPRDSAKVTRKGISHRGMRYVPDRGEELSVGDRVTYAYDSSDTSAIYVIKEDKTMVTCYLAPSSSRYQGCDMTDVSVMRKQEREKVRVARQKESEVRIKLLEEIQDIIRQAEGEQADRKDITDIANNRSLERSRLT